MITKEFKLSTTRRQTWFPTKHLPLRNGFLPFLIGKWGNSSFPLWNLISKVSQGLEVRCQTILIIDNKSLFVLCSNRKKKKKWKVHLWCCSSFWSCSSGYCITFCLYLFLSAIAWQAKLLDCVMYQSFQHLGFHIIINTQEHRNRSKINIPLYSSLSPMHQLLPWDKEMLGIPQLDGEQRRESSQWNAGSSLAVNKQNGR